MNLETLNQIFPQHRLGSGTPVVLTERQVRAVAEKAGFKPGVAKQMAQIARGESSFQPGVVSNDGGYGLWQMTPRVWGPEAIKHMNKLGGLKAMSNPLLNAKMAKWLYDRGGFDPWYGTKYLDRNLDTSKVRSVLNASDRRKGYIAAVQDGQPQTRRDTTTTIEPGGQDIEGALMDMLLSGSGKVERVGSGNSLLQRLTYALDSGLYTQPDVVTKHTTESRVPGAPTSMKTAAKPGGGKLKNRTGVVRFDGRPVAAWIAPILREARRDGVKFTLSSGYRTDAEQKRIYDSGVHPAAKPKAYGGGGSNHEGDAFPAGAVDLNSRDGSAQRFAEWLQRSKYRNLLVFAGAKDPVHFSHPHNGSY